VCEGRREGKSEKNREREKERREGEGHGEEGEEEGEGEVKGQDRGRWGKERPLALNANDGFKVQLVRSCESEFVTNNGSGC
jgi:hypothetical protein